MQQRRYGIAVTTELDVEDADARIREALAAEGFGILTEIDVAATLKQKLDVDRPPYRILGACNPALANQALEVEEEIGVLLPCNVVVYESEEGTVVEAMDPNLMADLTTNPGLGPIAAEARWRIERALATLG